MSRQVRRRRRPQTGPEIDFLLSAPMRADRVLWDFAQMYRKMWTSDHPNIELSADQAAIAALLSFEAVGFAVRHTDSDGSITWKTTAKFLSSTSLEVGSLVTIGPLTSTH